MKLAGLRPTGIVLMTLAAFGAASCGSSAKPAAVTTTTSATTSTSTTTTTSTSAATTSTTVAGATTTTSPPLAGWVRPTQNADGSIAVGGFNARLASDKPTWANDAQRVAKEFLVASTLDAASVDVQVTNPSPQLAEVVVTVDGLADDSIRAIRYDVHLQRQPDQTWRLQSASWSQKCQPNRGHQTFTTELCI